MKYSETGEPSSLDQADQERLQMVESYLQSVGPEEAAVNGEMTPGGLPKKDPVEDVEAFMDELAAAAAGTSSPDVRPTVI